MAWRLSTGLRDSLLEYAAKAVFGMTGTTISFGDGDGTGGRDTINDSANGLAGVNPGDMLTILGSSGNDKTVRVLSASAGTLEVAEGSFVAEAAGAQVILVACVGGSYAGVLRNATMKIFTGPQPASADDAETGAELIPITLGSGVFVPGSPENGLNFRQVADATLRKAIDPATGVAETWSGVAIASGTAGWFRIYANDVTEGASLSAIRIDGSIATSGAQLNMTSTSIISGVTTTVDSVNMPLPESP